VGLVPTLLGERPHSMARTVHGWFEVVGSVWATIAGLKRRTAEAQEKKGCGAGLCSKPEGMDDSCRDGSQAGENAGVDAGKA
jgi:hypothetical protein